MACSCSRGHPAHSAPAAAGAQHLWLPTHCVLCCAALGWLRFALQSPENSHTASDIGQFLSSPCVFLAYPSQFDGDKVFGTGASFSLQMNLSTLFLIRQECASLPSPPPYPHPLPSKLPSLCNLDRKPCRILDRLKESGSAPHAFVAHMGPAGAEQTGGRGSPQAMDAPRELPVSQSPFPNNLARFWVRAQPWRARGWL